MSDTLTITVTIDEIRTDAERDAISSAISDVALDVWSPLSDDVTAPAATVGFSGSYGDFEEVHDLLVEMGLAHTITHDPYAEFDGELRRFDGVFLTLMAPCNADGEVYLTAGHILQALAGRIPLALAQATGHPEMEGVTPDPYEALERIAEIVGDRTHKDWADIAEIVEEVLGA
jgi:sugar phosphate isomerase/epimerase